MNFRKNSIVYLLSNIINAMVPFLLLPVLTRYLTKEEFGNLAIFTMIVAMLPVVIEYCVAGSVTRKFYEYEDNEFKRYIITVIKIITFGLIITLFVFYGLLDYIQNNINIDVKWILFACIISFNESVISIRLTLWQLNDSPIKYGFFIFIKVFIVASITLLFIVPLGYGLDGRVTAMLIGTSIISLLSLFLIFKYVRNYLFSRIEKKHIKEAFKYGFGIIPHVLGLFILSYADRYLIERNIGLESVAIYVLALQISSVINVICTSVNKAFTPWLFSLLKKNDEIEKKKLIKNTYIASLFLILIGLGGFVIGPQLVVFIGGIEYKEAGDIIGYLVLGQIFSGMYLMVTNYIFYAQKTEILSLSTILVGLFNIFILLILVRYNGLVGVAQAYSLSQLVRFLSTWILAMNIIKMPWFNFLTSRE